MMCQAADPPHYMKRFTVESFCLRQWEASYSGSKFYDTGVTVEQVEALVNAQPDSALKDGYAPFCKHLFIQNTLSNKLQAADVDITHELLPYIKSGYEARTPKELPVLTRWVLAKDAVPKPALWLDVILYSREQITKEDLATGSSPSTSTSPWGIISIKAQNDGFELPMTPMTMLRNSLGKEYGGSGVPLNKAEYDKAVKYWECHVFVKAG
jgi:hypothetical protein